MNQFASSLQHKPMINRLDNARALAFIRALREVVADNNRPKQVDVVIERSEITEESIKQNVTAVQAARDTMKRRN
jgi:D-alanyl-D-alanine dipeptidase